MCWIYDATTNGQLRFEAVRVNATAKVGSSATWNNRYLNSAQTAKH